MCCFLPTAGAFGWAVNEWAVHNRRLILGLLCALFLGFNSVVQAHEETFESPETTWRLAESDCRPLRFSTHERQFSGAHGGNGCEHLQLVAGQGTHIYLAHPIQPTRIINELIPSIWVKADRHGLQLMARVVLPRSRENGKPITSFVYGDRYETSDTWRQLRIDDILTKVNREVVALRTQKGPQLDGREAYIDLLVLNAYTGPGPTNIWTDDLQLTGFAPANEVATNRDEFPNAPIEANSPAPADAPNDFSGVTLQGSILVATGRPLFVRAIEHQGETFAFLKSLGFNTVKLAAAPTAGQLHDAERCDVWLIGPPPISAISKSEERPWSHANHRVLAWHLGENLTARDSQATLARIEELQHREPAFQRPSVAHIASGFSQWRQDSLIQLLEHPVLHSSFEMQDFHEWLDYAARQNRSQAPYWCAIPTEPSEELISQVNHLRTRSIPQLESDQVRWLAFAAVGSGARGLWFRSRTRLDGQDPVARRRAATLRYLNRELELISPWAAGGTADGEQATNNPRLRAFALQTDRARLLIVLRRTAELQFVIAPSDQETNRRHIASSSSHRSDLLRVASWNPAHHQSTWRRHAIDVCFTRCCVAGTTHIRSHGGELCRSDFGSHSPGRRRRSPRDAHATSRGDGIRGETFAGPRSSESAQRSKVGGRAIAIAACR